MRIRNILAVTAIMGAFACSKSDQNSTDSLALATRNQQLLDSITQRLWPMGGVQTNLPD